MKNIFSIPVNTLLISILMLTMFFLDGCQKGIGTNNTTNMLLDSVITNYSNSYPISIYSLNFIYDEQERVIEERINRLDSPMLIRRTYEYMGNDPLPFKKNHFNASNVNPQFSAVFSYNNAGKKIYDSAYYLPASGYNGYLTIKFDYSVASKIIVSQKVSMSTGIYNCIDTIILNNTGGVDSTILGWLAIDKYEQYDNRLNHLNSLSINQCNFYMSHPDNFTFLFTGGYNNIPEPSLDYFNTRYCTAKRLYSPGNNLSWYATYQYQFNNDNLPVSRITIVNGIVHATTRFVYK